MITEQGRAKVHEREFVEHLRQVPYDVLHQGLYHSGELFDQLKAGDESSVARCYDQIVYQHVVATGKQPAQSHEMLGRCLHDFEMRKAVRTYLDQYDKLQVVGIMGGHAMKRNDDNYRVTALISKTLTEKGSLMISGGGPGAMEATHFGAWMAGRTMAEFEDALSILATATDFSTLGWYITAKDVMEKYPQESGYESLSIPTWFYGHEPPALFATHTAKLFDNSIREDLLLTEAYGGLIIMPGSAGTLQEIFQEAVQNHYNIFGFPSPMVLVDRKYWTETVPVYPFLVTMIEKQSYKNILLKLADDPDDVIRYIMDFRKFQANEC